MPAPFRVGSVVQLKSPVWGRRELYPNGPYTGQLVAISRHDDQIGASFFRDHRGQEWIVSALPGGAWEGVQILDYPGLTAWRKAVEEGKTIDGYNEWAKAQQEEALQS